MALPLHITTPPPPLAPACTGEDFAGIEDLDRAELDEIPDTDPTPPPTLPSLEWDDDAESGVKQRRSV